MALGEFASTYETPHIPYPESPQKIMVGKFEVYDYVPPSRVDQCIRDISAVIKLDDYEAVVVNMQGGRFLYARLAQLQEYNGPHVEVEYHRPKGGFGAEIVRLVPQYLYGKKIALVDDITDSGGTAAEILKQQDPQSAAIFLVTKRGVVNQIKIPNTIIGMQIEDRWVGGCGMDIGFKGEKDVFRNYGGLVVNPNAGFGL